MKSLADVLTEQEWSDLGQRYRAAFGVGIPFTMLPADGEAAVALINRAIEAKNEDLIDADLPEGALI